MSDNLQYVKQEEFRLVLILSWSEMVLVELDIETYRLPRMRIPRWTRPAEQLSETIRAKWGVLPIVIDMLPGAHGLPRCAVIEISTHNWDYARHGLISIYADELTDLDLTDIEYLTIRGIIVRDTQSRGPFSKLGWVKEAQAWIQESVTNHRIAFNEDIRQLSADGFFALVRFGTHGGQAYWLKATNSPNECEFRITQTIARCCPQFLPPLIAARADWNAWVTEEVGRPLHEVFSLRTFEQTTYCLAEMQIESVRYAEELVACGCFDQRMSILRRQMNGLIDYLKDAMCRQTSTKVPPISAQRLEELKLLIEAASTAMDAIGIPGTLIHNDINSGNILFDGTRAVFTDWVEAGVGCPFLTFQHLHVQALEADETHTWAARLKDIYKEHWRSVLSESQIKKAFGLAPPLAIASYLCGRDGTFSSPIRSDSSVQSYARSLARHLDRFARTPEFLEALCS